MRSLPFLLVGVIGAEVDMDELDAMDAEEDMDEFDGEDLEDEEEVSPSELLDYMDTDKDGKVTMKEAWEAVAREVEEFSNEDGEPLTAEPPAHIKEVMDKADANGNSLIDLDEMLPFVEELTSVVDLDGEDFEADDDFEM